MQIIHLAAIGIAAWYGTAQAGEHWAKLEPGRWQGQAAAGGQFDLARGLVAITLPKQVVDGHWLRLSGKTSSTTPDFNVWFHVFDEQKRPVSRPVPGTCHIAGGTKTCRNWAWIAPGGASARAAFYSYQWQGLVEPGDLEIARGAPASPVNEQRYADLAARIRSLYFRTREADWEAAIATGRLALAAPAEIDPVPQAIALLVGRLPGNSHSKVYASKAAPSGQIPAALPACVRLQHGKWRLDLPATPDGAQYESTYIASAHQCLRQAGVGHWVVNLTQNGGGDTALQFGALAPLFGQGAQMMFKNSAGSAFAVVLNKRSVAVGGELRHSWPVYVPKYRGKATFVVGPGCASACESIAIAAKGKFFMVGRATAGYATSNESLVINENYALALTSGVMASLDGKIFSNVAPDVLLSDAAMKKLLAQRH